MCRPILTHLKVEKLTEMQREQLKCLEQYLEDTQLALDKYSDEHHPESALALAKTIGQCLPKLSKVQR